jgi:hypothetical protein
MSFATKIAISIALGGVCLGGCAALVVACHVDRRVIDDQGVDYAADACRS